MIRNKKRSVGSYTAALIVAMCMAVSLPAQTAETTPAATGQSAAIDPLWWLIIAVMIVLLFAVLLLSNVLLNVARILLEKSKQNKGAATLLLLLLTLSGYAQQAPAPAAAANTASAFPDWNLILAFAVIAMELFVIVVLVTRIQGMLNELSETKREAKSFDIHLPHFLDNLNASVSVEHEKDVLLDHNYDGIQELDNSLPPWWKYGFYATIVYACAYLFYYHVAGGPTSHDQYEAEMAAAKIAKEEYMKKNALNVDENNVTLADASGIAEGKTLFTANCSPCHGPDGGSAPGGVGPNLTDDYWLHGGSLADVFKSIKYGWPAKGMISWQNNFTPVQIKDLASFVKSIHGTKTATPKEPQGELFREGVAATDSTTAASGDSSATASK